MFSQNKIGFSHALNPIVSYEIKQANVIASALCEAEKHPR